MHLATTEDQHFRCSFLHVPCLPQQGARAGNSSPMALDDIVRSIGIVLEIAAAPTD
jgi:pyrrolidone-carboxylate peptidase